MRYLVAILAVRYGSFPLEFMTTSHTKFSHPYVMTCKKQKGSRGLITIYMFEIVAGCDVSSVRRSLGLPSDTIIRFHLGWICAMMLDARRDQHRGECRRPRAIGSGS